MEDAISKEIHAQIAAFSAEGLRVLAFAEKTLPENRPLTLEDENDLTFVGLIAMMDPHREESAAAVAALSLIHILIKLITPCPQH